MDRDTEAEARIISFCLLHHRPPGNRWLITGNRQSLTRSSCSIRIKWRELGFSCHCINPIQMVIRLDLPITAETSWQRIPISSTHSNRTKLSSTFIEQNLQILYLIFLPPIFNHLRSTNLETIKQTVDLVFTIPCNISNNVLSKMYGRHLR